MARKIIVGVLLLTLVNFFMGCVISQTDKVPGVATAGLSPSDYIAAVVLTDGSTITFDNRGGKHSSDPIPMILGTSPSGDSIRAPLSDVRQCRVSPPVSIAAADLDTMPIAELVLKDRTFVPFKAPGGTYDEKAQVIRGVHTIQGDVSYALSDVSSIRVSRPQLMWPLDLKSQPLQKVYEFIDQNFKVWAFDSTGGHLAAKSGFYGTDINGNNVEVPDDDVLYASVKRVDPGLTALATLGVIVGVVGVVAIIIAATKQSCPFIYSFNGEQFVFDAEPLGGAICPGLARTDISRLDFVKPVGREYRLLVRNEVPETQYIDKMKLLIVDHAPEMIVYPDLKGTFYAFKNVQVATSATDEKGMSLMKFLIASDQIAWQTHLPVACRDTTGPTRHEITVTLPKPRNARRAWLVTNIGTSLWGSNMIRKTVEYRGNSAQGWLASLTPGSPGLAEMNGFLEREEMYHLKTWMKTGSTWTQATTIIGQGPLISEDRVYPIDVSKAAGDSLVLRFNPPKGFWTFDYLAVSYDDPLVAMPLQVNASQAGDQNGNSIADKLCSQDSLYYAMPDVGNFARVNFNAPENREGMTRSIVLETSGYYQLHLAKDVPDQLARLYSIALQPGQIVRTAMEEFRAWIAQQDIARRQPPQQAEQSETR